MAATDTAADAAKVPPRLCRALSGLAKSGKLILLFGMWRWIAFCGMLAFATVSLGEEELPKNDQEEESFEVEPPLLIPYRDTETQGSTTAVATTPATVDIERLTKDVERAKRSAINAERLFKIGVLAKVEAEQRALRAVRLQSDLENARLAQAKTNALEQSQEKNETPSANPAPSPDEAALARAIEAAHAAAKKREQAELEAAEANLTRQQKLLSLGSGRKADVAKAERKLAELKAARN